MDPDGTHLAQLTTVQSSFPRWSPDGTRIAFTIRIGIDAFLEIAVMNADGSDKGRSPPTTPTTRLRTGPLTERVSCITAGGRDARASS